MEVTLLGRFEVHVNGVAVPEQRWRGRRAPSLVKLLALGPGHRLHREQVIDALWPALSVAEATPRLHKTVHLARAALGDHGALGTANERIELWPTAEVVVDLDRFEALASTARTSCEPQDLRDAINAYRGDLLPDDVYEPWASAARERLRVQYGELLRLAERWEQLIALDPTDEVAHLHIARRLVNRRDRAGALRQLDHLTNALQRELDIEPSEAAQRLREEVLALPIDVSAASTVVPHVAMPVPLTPLVGRRRELTELIAALDAERLVTVTGPGGAGKTRLALAAIERCLGSAAPTSCSSTSPGSRIQRSSTQRSLTPLRYRSRRGRIASTRWLSPWLTGRPCCSSTTASTSRTRPASASSDCSSDARPSASWPRAGCG